MEAKIIELLLHFGLSRPEAKIYILLLREGPLSGYEAAKRTGISRSNAYGALASLVEKGAAYIIEEQAVQYQAVALEEFCDNHLHFLREVSKELKASMPAQKKRNENYITIRGKRNVEDKMRNMLAQAQERIYLSASANLLIPYERELKQLLEQGKKVVLITDEDYKLQGALHYGMPRQDTQIRLITDSSNALTGEMGDEWQTACLYSENPNLVKLLKEALSNEIKLISMGEG